MASKSELILEMKALKTNTEQVLRGLMGQLEDLEEKFEDTGKQAKKTSDKIRESFRRADKKIIGAVKKWGTILGTAGFVGTMYKAVRAANDFQKSMAEVSTLLGKDAPQQMKKYDKAIKDLAMRSSATATELSKGLYQVISAGTKGTQDAAGAMKLLEAAHKASVAGVSDTFAAVDLLTTSLNAYQASADRATEFSDILFKSVKLGKLTFDDLAQGMGTVASAAAGANISFEEVNAAMAAMTAGGVPVARAFTSLNAIMRVAAKGSKELNAAFGEATSKLLEREGLVGVLQKLKDITGGSTIELQKLKIEQEAITGLAVLASSGIDKFRSSLEEMKDASGATETAYQKMAATFDQQTKMFWSKLNVLLIELGEQVMPAILEALQSFGDYVKENKGDIVNGFVAIAKAVGGLAKVLMMAVKGWGYLVTAFKEGGQLIEDKVKDMTLAALPLLKVIGEDYRKEVEKSVNFMKNQSKVLGPLMRDLGWFGGRGTTVTAGIASGLYQAAVETGPAPAGVGAAPGKPGKPPRTEEQEKALKAWLAQRKAALNALFALETANADKLQQLKMKYNKDREAWEKRKGLKDAEREKALALLKKKYENDVFEERQKIEKQLTEIRNEYLKASAKAWSNWMKEGLERAMSAAAYGAKAKAGGAKALEQYREMRASWSARMAGKFDEDEPGVLQQVATGFLEKAGSALYDWAGTLVSTLAGGKEAVQGMVEQAIAFWESLANNLDDALIYLAEEGIPKIIDAVIDNLPQVVGAVIRNIPKIIAAVIEQVPKIAAALAKAVYEAVRGFFEGIGDMFADFFTGGQATAEQRERRREHTRQQIKRMGRANVPKQPPSFHLGGFVEQISDFRKAITAHSGMFVQPKGGREIPAILEAGEGVIRKEMTAALGGQAAIDAINRGEGIGSTIINNYLSVEHMMSEDTEKVVDNMQSNSYRKSTGRMTQIIDAGQVAGLEFAK